MPKTATKQLTCPKSSTEFAPSLLLANVMSLVPKVDEVRLFASQRYFDFLFYHRNMAEERYR